MSVSKLSVSTQNYLKEIWAASEWSDSPITATILAERLGLKMPTVSEGIRKLQKQGFVTHTPYGSVQLTELGSENALQMVRRHRLLETFLVETLGYSWDEVHDEAENLEHAVSDLLVERIDKLLGRPKRDPHGDPIPDARGIVRAPNAVQLSSITPPATVRVERIADDDPELLQHFLNCQINIGSVLKAAPGTPFSETIIVTCESDGQKVTLGTEATAALYVSQLDDSGSHITGSNLPEVKL